MKFFLGLSIALSAALSAAGYKIPENSINATALSAAYIANAHGADAAYYNPAAMVYNDNANLLEVDATYIGLSGIDFAGTVGDYRSKKENFLVPTLHFSSKKLGENNARIGLNIVAPAGLSKRWSAAVPKSSAEEFTLKTVEINPTFAISVNEHLSFGAGVRVVRSEGVVKSDTGAPTYVSRNLKGDSTDIGYNLALMYQPIKELSLAATYRSKVDLTIEGDADLNYLPSIHPWHSTYSGSASVTVPIPATLSLAAAYTFDTGTTVEMVYERNYWSRYQTLDFDYDGTLNTATNFFGAQIAKNWCNTNTYRLGLTQKFDRWRAMVGIAYDETPIPESTLGYELPDSDAWIYSLGLRYQIDKQWNIGVAALVDAKKSRDVKNVSIDGEFTNARAYLATAGIEYRF